MQLQTDLWIEGAYYIDFDRYRQLRIVGPHNHLHYGSAAPSDSQLTIDKVETDHGRAKISAHLDKPAAFWPDPIVGPIRVLRQLIDGPDRRARFDEIPKRHHSDVSPDYIGLDGSAITYKRHYGRHWYGCRVEFDPRVAIRRVDSLKGFELESSQPIAFTITAETDQPIVAALPSVVTSSNPEFSAAGNDAQSLRTLWERTGVELAHMIRYGKTSGFDYGTVFPRDWMESADLAGPDLLPATSSYMYWLSLSHVDPRGIGWHEEMVGEQLYREHRRIQRLEEDIEDLSGVTSPAKNRLKRLLGRIRASAVARNMIDIEPRYLMNLDQWMSGDPDTETIRRLQLVARFVVRQADRHQLITFRKIPTLLQRHKYEQYYSVGNWRDSKDAYKQIHPVIAPYDVNVVFYPQALAAMRRHYRALKLSASELDRLITKWSRPKDWFRFANPDGTPAFALALYDVRESKQGIEFKKLEVNHTDEAYDLFYNHPSEGDVVSFCRRLLSPEYFYTPSGPIIVGRGDGYKSNQYHGQVVWTKQTAFTVAGLGKQLEACRSLDWQPDTEKLITKAITVTSKTCIKAWGDMAAIPELHYDDAGRARLFSDQPGVAAPMNRVQLWSSAGARRIIRTYLEVKQNVTK